jgi:hypothetical protein
MVTIQLNAQTMALLKFWARAASLAVILVGGLVLVGWSLDLALLKSLAPGLATMKANTALSFVLAGLSLWLSRPEPPARRQPNPQICAGLVTVLALATHSQDLFGWNLGIDQLSNTPQPPAATRSG